MLVLVMPMTMRHIYIYTYKYISLPVFVVGSQLGLLPGRGQRCEGPHQMGGLQVKFASREICTAQETALRSQRLNFALEFLANILSNGPNGKQMGAEVLKLI